MNTSCNIPKECNFWFCQEKGKCLLDKNSTTPQRFVKVKVKKKSNKHPKRVSMLISKGHKPHCACCRTKKELTFDHIIPLSKEGKNTLENGQILCITCNRIKGNKIISNNRLKKMVQRRKEIK